jgi:hypothetical protein
VTTVVVRVSVDGADSAEALIRELVPKVNAEHVYFESATQQVCVEVGRDPDQMLVAVLGIVEAWLGGRGRATTTVAVDERNYTLGPAPLAEAAQ